MFKSKRRARIGEDIFRIENHNDSWVICVGLCSDLLHLRHWFMDINDPLDGGCLHWSAWSGFSSHILSFPLTSFISKITAPGQGLWGIIFQGGRWAAKLFHMKCFINSVQTKRSGIHSFCRLPSLLVSQSIIVMAKSLNSHFPSCPYWLKSVAANKLFRTLRWQPDKLFF